MVRNRWFILKFKKDRFMLRRIATSLWGNFKSRDEIKKFILLALIFGVIIGTYWGFRTMKDSIFNAMVGIDFQPWAKILSLCVVVPLVIIYSKLIDKFPRHRVFYMLTLFYGVGALVFMLIFLHPTIGLSNTIKDPSRLVAWLWYVFVESFGSLIVALFWAFSTDINLPDAARRGFPIIALFGQLGNILGPYFLKAQRWGFANSGPVVGICGGLIFLMGILMWVFMHVVPQSELVGFKEEETDEKKEKAGFLDGLKLLITQGYLLGIFWVILVFEAVSTIVDFQFKTLLFAKYTTEAASQAALSNYATWTGIIAALCILLGINSIQRILGIRASLILLPVLVASAVVVMKVYPSVYALAFVIMVLLKAVNYALNQPTLKQLYIPTTKDSKYKAQAWIEMFGGRGSKAIGSGINTLRKVFISKYGIATGINSFLMVSSIASLGLIAVWVFVALYLARIYNSAIKEDRVVC